MFDVVTIGTATRDVFVESDLFKIVRDPAHLERLGFPTGEAQCFALGGKIEIGRPTLSFGGGATNAAVTFRRQGFRTAAVAKIGDDENGSAVFGNMKAHGITSFMPKDKKEGSAYSVILLSPSGERTILSYRGASEDLKINEVPVSKIKAKAAYIVPGRIDFKVIYGLASALKKKGSFIAMNPSSHYLEMGAKRLAPLLKITDVITLNREEAAALTGEKFEHEARIFKAFESLMPGIAVMTDGPNGVLVSNGRNIFSAGVYKEKRIMNRTGAGDAFGSGFVAGLLKHGELSRTASDDAILHAMKLASANATSVVEHMGAQKGILTAREFTSQPRWKALKINVKKI